MTILFVCTGNTCRSPMAAALMRRALDKRGRRDIMVSSAGLAAYGEPANPNAVKVMAELDDSLGAVLDKHLSHMVTRSMIEQAGIIAVMSRHHATSMGKLGAASDKVTVLSAGDTEGIADPYGGSLDTYRFTRDALEKAVETLADTIL